MLEGRLRQFRGDKIVPGFFTRTWPDYILCLCVSCFCLSGQGASFRLCYLCFGCFVFAVEVAKGFAREGLSFRKH